MKRLRRMISRCRVRFEGYLAGFAKDLWFLRAMRSDAHAGEACDTKAEEKTAGGQALLPQKGLIKDA